MGRLKRFKAPKIATVIGNGTAVKGDLQFSGGLHVDGSVHGSVIAEQDDRSTLILSEQGLIEGDVRVPNIILNGKVVGDVYASQRVELASNARVVGTLYYKALEMAMGAEVNGQLVFTEELETRRLVYDADSDEASLDQAEEVAADSLDISRD